MSEPKIMLDRTGVRRLCMYIEKKIRKICHENWYSNPPVWTVQGPIKEILDDLRNRQAFVEYNLIVSEGSVTVEFKKLEDSPPITIEVFLTHESEHKNEF